MLEDFYGGGGFVHGAGRRFVSMVVEVFGLSLALPHSVLLGAVLCLWCRCFFCVFLLFSPLFRTLSPSPCLFGLISLWVHRGHYGSIMDTLGTSWTHNTSLIFCVTV